jgi:cyclophilin family peptidyl-prolyl cis-trans isomerase
LTTLTLQGTQLDHDIRVIADSEKCSNLTLDPANSANIRTATCTVVGTGPAFFTVRSHAGYVLYTTSLQVPEPITKISASNLGFGQVNLTLEGDPHTPGIRLSSDKCTNITLAPVTSGTSRSASCTLLTSGPVRFDVTNPNGTVKLYSQTLIAAAPTTLSALNLKYGQKAYFAYPPGASLLQLQSAACKDIAQETALSNADTQVSSCTIRQTGNSLFAVVDSNTATVQQASLTVPAPQVSLLTSLGTVVMELNPTAAPITVDNFLAYVNQSPSFYVGTIFHRVMPGFVVQGGGFTSGNTMTQKTGLQPPITLESNNGLRNDRSTVAMARTDTPNSATSQFYFNLVNNTSLNYVNPTNPGYAVFGRVITGMSVIDQIASQPTRSSAGSSNVPVTDITVLSAVQTQ